MKTKERIVNRLLGIKQYEFLCPICGKIYITDDYELYWDFKMLCDNCGKSSYFYGRI